MSAVEQLEGSITCPHARPVGQYGELAAVADRKVLRGVIGHAPAGADEAELYLSLVYWLPPVPTPCSYILYMVGVAVIARHEGRSLKLSKDPP